MSEVSAEISLDDAACRRGTGRASLSFPTTIMLSDGQFSCQLEDISLGGARISTDEKLAPGRSLWLKLDRHEAFGNVAWASDSEYGIKFDRRLPKVIVMQMQGHSVDLEEYEAAQTRRAAKIWAQGEGRVTRSRLMRLLDVVGHRSRDEFPACAPCDHGEPCLVHCGYKQYRAHRRAHRARVVCYLGIAAIVGALLGIASDFVTRHSRGRISSVPCCPSSSRGCIRHCPEPGLFPAGGISAIFRRISSTDAGHALHQLAGPGR